METNELFGSVYSDLSPGIGTTARDGHLFRLICVYSLFRDNPLKLSGACILITSFSLPERTNEPTDTSFEFKLIF